MKHMHIFYPAGIMAGFLFLALPSSEAKTAKKNDCITSIQIGGYVGQRIDDCVKKRVMPQDIHEITDVFARQDELKNSWKTEFWGKWVQGAIGACQYHSCPQLYQLIESSVKKIKDSQLNNGYIGNYDCQHQLQGWDVWGRKYTLLGLLKWHDLSGDKEALRAACRLTDYTMTQIGEGKAHIYECGNFKGMASASILEPLVYLYNKTGKQKYLDFARFLVEDSERPGGPQLLAKCNEPVYKRFPVPSEKWWTESNGQKAYEMMSCYVGLLELGKVLHTEEYAEAVKTAVRHIEEEEINICGSGAANECWYQGRLRQTIPSYHTMETCVGFTWMQLNERLLEITHDPHYADNMEQTFYNAILAAMKDDASQIVKYTPLEGHRMEGERQCDLNINCCNANGPRAYAMFPRATYQQGGEHTLYANFYTPSTVSAIINGTPVKIEQTTEYPKHGTVKFHVSPEKEVSFCLALRIPSWSRNTTVKVNGTVCEGVNTGSYYAIRRQWKKGDTVELSLDMRTRITELNHMQALQRGPITFARDSRFCDGFVDETCVIKADKDGYVDARLSPSPAGMWITLEIPARMGTYTENVSSGTFHVCDFASAGNTWSPDCRYRVWLTKTIDAIKESNDHIITNTK